MIMPQSNVNLMLLQHKEELEMEKKAQEEAVVKMERQQTAAKERKIKMDEEREMERQKSAKEEELR